jgi:hypothetical protein
MDWIYPTMGFMYFHMGTGLHSAFEMNMAEGMSISQHEQNQMIDFAMSYIDDKLVDDMRAGFETKYANHTPDLDAVADGVSECVTNWCRDVHVDSNARPYWMDGEVWPPELEKRAELPGFATDIDAVFPDDDGFIVVDWKTGARPKADGIQLRIYAWALRQLGYGPCRDALFYHARKGVWQPVEVPNTQGEDQYIEQLIAATAMTKGDETLALQPRLGWYCNTVCPHQDRCPAFGGDLTALQTHYRMGEWTNDKVQRD